MNLKSQLKNGQLYASPKFLGLHLNCAFIEIIEHTLHLISNLFTDDFN